MQNNHWAMTAGHYLLQRRKKTHTAYSNHLLAQSDKQGSELNVMSTHHGDLVSQVLCFLLGVELEAGHTVIHIEQDTDYTWQAKIIDTLLVNWLELPDIAEKFTTNKSTMTSCLADFDGINQLKQILFNNNQIEKVQRQYLLNQLDLAIQLNTFFHAFNRAYAPDVSVQNFFQHICQLPLVVDQSAEQIHKPIVASFDQQHSKITLWLHRSWQAETSIINHIHRLNNAEPNQFDLAHIEQDTLKDEQLKAIHVTNQSAFSIITGGPGTGKTYTVAQLVIALYYANQGIKDNDKKIRLILTAPTGKAAQRMQESLQSALDRAGVKMNLQEAKTIHRLLGIGQAGMPRYSQDFPLAEDVIIVDEASMLGVELASYLLASVKTGARLILLGDAHQLSAVEAGSVLGDLCHIEALKKVHATLEQSSRFNDNSPIGQLAHLINNPQAETQSKQALQGLFDTYSDELHLYTIFQRYDDRYNAQLITTYQQLNTEYQPYFAFTQLLLTASNIEQCLYDNLPDLLPTFNKFRILTAGHHGDYGDDHINEVLSQYHRQYLALPRLQSDWYHGRPVMVRKNNYNLALFNGDIGVCVDTGEGLAVYFEGKDTPLPVNMLVNLDVSTAYAMTVHKSQGSEFDHVAVMVSQTDNKRLLSRELIYTAITRAKTKASIYGTVSIIADAMHQPTVRYTGLALV